MSAGLGRGRSADSRGFEEGGGGEGAVLLVRPPEDEAVGQVEEEGDEDAHPHHPARHPPVAEVRLLAVRRVPQVQYSV